MKKPARTLSRCTLVVCVLGIMATATVSLATPRPRGCFRLIACLDVWDPVICDNGQVYSNSCYAYRACATGCVPY
jgi:hypothetical protein